MSRDISWINEIKNNTKDTYIIWCWDTDNEGEYKDFRTNQLIGKNDGGKRVRIAPGAHLAVGGCGIPDGGDKDGKPKARVIVKESLAMPGAADPGRGLRLNRVMVAGERDALRYADHSDPQRVFGQISFPRGQEQNLILTINPDGIKLEAKEVKESTEWKAYKGAQHVMESIDLKELFSLGMKAASAALAAA